MLRKGAATRALQENASTRTPPMRPIAAFTPASYVRDNVIGLAAFLLALASTVLIRLRSA